MQLPCNLAPPPLASVSVSSSELPNLSPDDLAFVKSLTHRTLHAASNSVYLGCLDSLVKKDEEISHLKDCIVDLQYVLHLYDRIYCMLTFPFRNQLIGALTSKLPSTMPSLNVLSPNLSLATSGTELSPLLDANYPNVKHWA